MTEKTILLPDSEQKPEYTRDQKAKKPSVSIITPAFNEAVIVVENLLVLSNYMQTLSEQYDWEIMVINDGSTDGTGAIADEFSRHHPNIRVIHHSENRNLGAALQTGFNKASGDYVIVMDLDLTYSEHHIEAMLTKIRDSNADMVIASPYMKGGKNTSVPFFRLMLSRVVNWLMQWMAPGKISTFTGMVRAYKRSFLKKLNLKSTTYSINPEIIFKGQILRAKIVEIPAHLDWTRQNKFGKTRKSGIRIFNGIAGGLMSGFIFRPYIVFMTVGLIFLIVAFYIIAWIFIQTFQALPEIALELGNIEDRFGMAVAKVFQERPYSFMVGGITLVVALQILGIGFLSLQNKRYFDELFHINTTLLKEKENQEK
ncbi:MAG: glycosyltransferase family 2 protein [Bacteroidetes bacterium]|nr:MAG: glycosyltransferase family 2 protein [Bacteroidota bacterium]